MSIYQLQKHYSTKNNIINYVTAPTAAGKTFALTQHIAASQSEKSLIIVPTKKLAVQYDSEFLKNSINNYSVINSDTHEEVHSEITKKVKEINFKGEGILIITLSSFLAIPIDIFGNKQDEWNVYCDEIPAVDKFYSPCIPYNKHHLLDHIELGDSVTAEMSYIQPKIIYSNALSNITDYQEVIRRNNDDIDNVIKPILKDLEDGYDILTDTSTFNNISNGIITDDIDAGDLEYGNKHNTFYFLSLMKPTRFFGWNSVTIMGANFEESMLHELWSRYYEVEFAKHPTLSNNLRFTTHGNGHILNIAYMQEGNWSKYKGNKIIEGKECKEYFIEMAQGFFKEKGISDVISFMNNDDVEKYTPDTWTKCPVVSHGLNTFQAYTGVYFAAALNRKPKHIAMLGEFGINADYATRCTSHEIVYQAISRCALRNLNNTQEIFAVVADKTMAEALSRLYIGCKIGPIDGVLKETKPMTKNERDHKNRRQKLINHRLLQGTIFKMSEIDNTFNELENWQIGATNSLYKEKCRTEMPKKLSLNDLIEYSPLDIQKKIPIYQTPFANKFSHPIGSHDHESVQNFVSDLESWFTNNVIASKEENYLLNSVIYKNKSRKLENALYATALYIDIDDGDLSPEEFHRIFSKIHPISHIVCNSASRSADDLTRYRAIFFVNEVMNDDTYRIVFNHICSLLQKCGYHTPKLTSREKFEEYCIKELIKNPDFKISGIDMSKNNLSSIFYAPCKIKGKEDYAFFWKFGTDARSVERYALNPTKILKHAPEELHKDEIVYLTETVIIDGNTTKIYDMRNTRLYKRILSLISNLTPGSRSYNSCVIGGCLQPFPDDIKDEVFSIMRSHGCNAEQMKAAKRYSNGVSYFKFHTIEKTTNKFGIIIPKSMKLG